MPSRHPWLTALVALLCFALGAGPARAADAAGTGVVTGRVQNAATDDYLNNARVTVEGTALEAFTNRYGEYRLAGVPAGEVTVTAHYTGLAARSQPVTVPAGGTARLDLNLGAATANEPVMLDKFVTSETHEMDTRAVAVNEQRYAPSLRNVVSADQFGDVTEGNVGEFVKFLPGVSVDYTAADARTISVRGLPSSTTPVTIDGNRIASAASSASTRTFELEQVSINNVSRVEVTKVPTPDVPADMLGGAVNLISTSAFERSKAQLRYRGFFSFNSESRQWDAVHAPGREPTRQIRPGFDLRYVDPVTPDFGFTVNALNSNQYNPQFRSQMQWVPNNVGSAAVPADNPYLSTFQISDVPKTTARSSVGATADWRPFARTVVSVSYQHNDYDAMFGGSNLTWAVGTNPTSWGPDYTQGRSGAGNATIGTNFRRKYGNTDHVSFKVKYEGDRWKIDGGGFYSASVNHYRDIDKGFFENVSLRIAGVTVRYSDIAGVRPGSISTTTPAGVTKNPFDLADYTILSARSSQNDGTDLQRGAHVNVQRDLDLAVPVSVKAGLDVRDSSRDIRYPQKTYTFVGADGVANSADDNAGFLVDEARKELGAPYGFPTPEWPSAYAMADLFRAHPEYFQDNAVTSYSTAVRNSKYIAETVSAAYLRADVRLLDQKLWLVGGVRYERTSDRGEGYQDNVNGVPAGVTDPLERAKLQLVDRGAHTTGRYDGYYPSANASYQFTDKLLLRLGYARTLGRPDFGNIIPGVTIPDSGGTNPIIVASNPNLKPWQANNYDVSLQYYYGASGSASVGVFQKDFSNFFGQTTQTATAALLAQFGLDPSLEADGYQIRYLQNVGDARVTGAEFDVSQPLGILGGWGERFTVFANATVLHLEGSTIADFSNFIPKNANWGVAYDDGRFGAGLNWNYRGEQRGVAVTGTGVPAGTYEYQAARLSLDAYAEYRFRRWLSVFATARNLTDEQQVIERYAPGTPGYAYQFRNDDYGIQVTVGVKGTF